MSAACHDHEQLERLAAGELRGERRRELSRHVDGCAECRDWLETYRLLRRELAAPGAAAGHPPSEQLARYAVEPGALTEAERRGIAAHLAGCRDCELDATLTGSAVAQARPAARLLPFAGGGSPRRRAVIGRLAAAAALVVAILGYAVSRIEAPAPTARTLDGSKLSGTRVVDAAESISATATTIESGGDVTFRAGEAVVLGEGFSIGENASFSVEIGRIADAPDDASDPPESRSAIESGVIENQPEPIVRQS